MQNVIEILTYRWYYMSELSKTQNKQLYIAFTMYSSLLYFNAYTSSTTTKCTQFQKKCVVCWIVIRKAINF